MAPRLLVYLPTCLFSPCPAVLSSIHSRHKYFFCGVNSPHYQLASRPFLTRSTGCGHVPLGAPVLTYLTLAGSPAPAFVDSDFKAWLRLHSSSTRSPHSCRSSFNVNVAFLWIKFSETQQGSREPAFRRALRFTAE
jgi:hypothetical protein